MTDTQDKPQWPPGVHEITWDDASRLGVDNKGHMYWDGIRIKTQERVTLSFLQGLGAFITVLSALTVAVVAVLTYLFN